MHTLTLNMLQSIQKIKNDMDIGTPQSHIGYSDLNNWDEIISLYEGLSDQNSQEVFLKVIVMRILCIMFPNDIVFKNFSIYTEIEWDNFHKEAKKIPILAGDVPLDRIETHILKCYEYENCRVENSDTVIDAGAFTGNTVKYFSNLCGKDGRVFAFEPMPHAFDFLTKNVNEIPQVKLFNHGLYKKKCTFYCKEQSGLGANIFQSGSMPISLCSLDEFIFENNIDKVDFIKMDIEGSEMDALEGARKTIQRFNPKMAICIYHKPEDIFQIYKRIIEYNPHYSFFIKHTVYNLYGTILFCMPSKTPHKYFNSYEKYSADISLTKCMYENYKNIHEYLSGVKYSNRPILHLDKYVDTLRETALSIEKESIFEAYKVMKLAHVIRPNGPVIRKKISEYNQKIERLLTEYKNISVN